MRLPKRFETELEHYAIYWKDDYYREPAGGIIGTWELAVRAFEWMLKKDLINNINYDKSKKTYMIYSELSCHVEDSDFCKYVFQCIKEICEELGDDER